MEYFENTLSLLFSAIVIGMMFSGSLLGAEKNYKSISPKEADKILKEDGSALLLDVRTAQEYSEVKVKNSKLIPVQVLETQLDELEDHKDKPILILCRSGNRSRTAAEILHAKGFKNLYNIEGGIMKWAGEVGGLVK